MEISYFLFPLRKHKYLCFYFNIVYLFNYDYLYSQLSFSDTNFVISFVFKQFIQLV